MGKKVFKIQGTTALIKALDKRADMDLVFRTVQMNTAEMQKAAIRNAPVDTSDLKKDIKISVTVTKDGIVGRVASEIEYAPYQEYGTRFQEGTPHISPAYHDQKYKFIRDMKRLGKIKAIHWKKK